MIGFIMVEVISIMVIKDKINKVIAAAEASAPYKSCFLPVGSKMPGLGFGIQPTATNVGNTKSMFMALPRPRLEFMYPKIITNSK